MFVEKQRLNRTIRKVLGGVGNFSAAWVSQEERFHFGVFSEKLKLTKSSVPSLITFNCDIKFPKGFLSL